MNTEYNNNNNNNNNHNVIIIRNRHNTEVTEENANNFNMEFPKGRSLQPRRDKYWRLYEYVKYRLKSYL